MPEDTQKVFISHASEDKERFVMQFAKRLRSQGIDAWVDIWEMLPGDSLVDKIFEEGIKNARAMVVVLSRFSVEKPWVREELNAGFLNRVSGRFKVIPVVIDDCDVPEALRSTVWQRITDLENYDAEFQRIVDAIYGRTQKPPLGSPVAIVRRQRIRDDLANNRVQTNLADAGYDQRDFEGLILDKYEAPVLRLQALQVYLTFVSVSANVLGQLLNDPDIDIRRTILRYIHKKPSPDFYELFDSKAIEKLMRDPEEEVVVAATRLACDLAEHGKIPRKILTAVNKHSYWLVRRIAIDCIIKTDDPETLDLLYEFRTTSYHVSQQLIRDYIEQHYEKFDDRQKQLAIDLLENLIRAKRASQISKTKNLKLLERLRNSDK